MDQALSTRCRPGGGRHTVLPTVLPAVRRFTRRCRPRQALSGQRGLTLIDCCIALAVTCLALGSALPHLQQARQRQHLHGMAAQLETDLHLARSQAAALNRVVRLSFAGQGDQACWAIHTGAAGVCSCISGQCSGPGQMLATRRLEGTLPLALRANVSSLAFSPHHGTVTPTATMRLHSPGGDEVRLVINLTGRVRSCTPSPALAAHLPAC